MIFRSLVALLVAALCTSCTPTVANRGNMVDPDKLAQIKPGESTRGEVLDLLGSPTQVGTFDENVWYYYGRTTEQYSFLDPEIINQETVEIRFDEAGIVTFAERLEPTAKEIDPVARRTPTYGRETTFLEQLLGNIGKPGPITKR